MATQEESVQEVVDEGKRVAQEQSQAAADNVSFFSRVQSAAGNVKSFINSKMGTLLIKLFKIGRAHV